MRKLGRKRLTLNLVNPLATLPAGLARWPLVLSNDGQTLVYDYDAKGDRSGIAPLLDALTTAGIPFRDLQTSQSSLEEIFVDLLKVDA